MLNFIFLKKKIINFFKNGFFLDYGLKIIIKNYIYNFYIKLSYFFAEKYLIEYNTKLIFNFFTSYYLQIDKYFFKHKNVVFMVLFILNLILLLI